MEVFRNLPGESVFKISFVKICVLNRQHYVPEVPEICLLPSSKDTQWKTQSLTLMEKVSEDKFWEYAWEKTHSAGRSAGVGQNVSGNLKSLYAVKIKLEGSF